MDTNLQLVLLRGEEVSPKLYHMLEFSRSCLTCPHGDGYDKDERWCECSEILDSFYRGFQ